MLEMCQNPELVTQVTLMPLARFDFDAAILFSDITIPFLGMDVAFDLAPGIGPVIEQPIRDKQAVERIRSFEPREDLAFIPEAIKLLRRELRVPLIGFAGAPFTLAAYLIEGKPSKDYRFIRSFMMSEPDLWNILMGKLVDMSISYLAMQVEAGAQALQIFDSWIGCLSRSLYSSAILPHMQRLFAGIEHCNVPVIHFGTANAHLFDLMQQAGGTVMGVDWRLSLSDAQKLLPTRCPLQGNLDPVAMLCPRKALLAKVEEILADEERAELSGHIFNLGHGILPETPIENVEAVIERVHSQKVL
jgi:uroporphyrinogen decarboxylase